MEVKSVRFVSLESKPVFRVYAVSGCFAAKFHEPAEHTLSQMKGEMRLLDYLSGHCMLSTEMPLANNKRGLVTKIRSAWLPGPAHVALTSWLPGRRLKNAISSSSYRHLGTCSARLHEASSSFRPGRKFRILTNNRVFYWDEETILSRKDRKLLPLRRQDLFREGAGIAKRAITTRWGSGKPIVIHNDLHPCNVKVHHGSLSMYDFEDITWGYPEQDIGTAMYHVRFRRDYPKLLGAFREGYEKVLHWPFDADSQLDDFVIARMLMFANYVVNYNIRPSKYLSQFEKNLRALLKVKAL